jgi:hypothetical protein
VTNDKVALSRFPTCRIRDANIEIARVFSGWERFLTDALMKDRRTRSVAFFLGLSEGYFPLLVGATYLLIGFVIYVGTLGFVWPGDLEYQILAVAYIILLVMLLFAALGGQLLRRIVISRRI